VVVAAEAADAVFLDEEFVEGFHALAFHAAQLGQGGAVGDGVIAEAHLVHAGGDVESSLWVGPGGHLLFEPVGGQ
jgi:hypothetical protein